MSTFRVRFNVHGAAAFPIDMLRYDGCYPASGKDSARLEDSLRRSSSTSSSKPITLEHIGEGRGAFVAWNPTNGRWESFGWHVDPASIESARLW